MFFSDDSNWKPIALKKNIIKYPGLFVVFEGTDGVGKTTIIQQVYNALQKNWIQGSHIKNTYRISV